MCLKTYLGRFDVKHGAVLDKDYLCCRMYFKRISWTKNRLRQILRHRAPFSVDVLLGMPSPVKYWVTSCLDIGHLFRLCHGSIFLTWHLWII